MKKVKRYLVQKKSFECEAIYENCMSCGAVKQNKKRLPCACFWRPFSLFASF